MSNENPSKVKLSIIIPTLNEENGIKKVLKRCSLLPFNKEIIMVDGGSTDRTIEIAKKYDVRIVTEKRMGYGRAYRTGFKHTRGEFIATMDGDGSYDPRDINKLFKILKNRKNVFISGCRFKNLKKESMPLINRFGNRLSSWVSNLFFGTDIKDNQSGMWLFHKDLLKKFILMEDGMSLSSEIKLEAYNKSRFIEYPISYEIRLGPKTMNPFKQGYGIFKFLLKRALLHHPSFEKV